ncbi:MAG: hypothetical protein QOG03_1554 [Actinomycetota bacterium]|nr:hypothetical protein [Actinomycetota bacterium]
MLLALVVAAVAAALTLGALDRWGPRQPPILLQRGESPDAARAFLGQWRRSRLATWAIDASFERHTARGTTVTATAHRAQAPPDRVATGFGSVEAVVGGYHLDCSTDASGAQHCTRGQRAQPYGSEVDAELTVLRTYVLGAPPLYAVREETPGCYRLRLVIAHYVSPPYGQVATFCWDRVTHAPVRSEIHRAEGADLTVTSAIRSRPTTADLTVPGAP